MARRDDRAERGRRAHDRITELMRLERADVARMSREQVVAEFIASVETSAFTKVQAASGVLDVDGMREGVACARAMARFLREVEALENAAEEDPMEV